MKTENDHRANWRDRLQIMELLGAGSRGRVYRVLLDGKAYALKQIDIPQCADSLKAAPARAEARRQMGMIRMVAKKLGRHPNIAAARAARISETEDGCRIELLMEYLTPLSRYEIRHAMGEKEVIRLGMEMCRALEECRKAKMIHCDLKPDNILVRPDGTFQLSDFGEAVFQEGRRENSRIRGTFAYMSPEMYHGRPFDHRSDIYSLGIVMYRMMNQGREPFIRPGERIVHRQAREDALNRRMEGEALPAPVCASAQLAAVLKKACAYHPGRRYGTARQFAGELSRIAGRR